MLNLENHAQKCKEINTLSLWAQKFVEVKLKWTLDIWSHFMRNINIDSDRSYGQYHSSWNLAKYKLFADVIFFKFWLELQLYDKQNLGLQSLS